MIEIIHTSYIILFFSIEKGSGIPLKMERQTITYPEDAPQEIIDKLATIFYL